MLTFLVSSGLSCANSAKIFLDGGSAAKIFPRIRTGEPARRYPIPGVLSRARAKN